ncbi:type II secretion system F family protein [bacterium]|nr:type II secretion system F family protein [bacterium]
MDLKIVIIALLAVSALIGVLLVILSVSAKKSRGGSGGSLAISESLRTLVASQREAQREGKDPQGKKNLAIAAAADGPETKRSALGSSANSLEKRLLYGRWIITPLQFRAIQVALTVALLVPATMYAAKTVWITVIIIVPALVSSFLDRSIKKVFNAFDKDYPVFLMQLVSLLKTGMSVMPAVDAAAKALPEDSLVRQEVALLLERLRLGMTEEQAINAFGEKVPHPEIELFVQSLLLSRRVGGTLSATLERLSKQVRRRQQFREKAIAAVGMERGSLLAIAFIMTLLLIYLSVSSPELILPAFKHKLGSAIFQTGLCLVFLGYYWSRKVTNIKV